MFFAEFGDENDKSIYDNLFIDYNNAVRTYDIMNEQFNSNFDPNSTIFLYFNDNIVGFLTFNIFTTDSETNCHICGIFINDNYRHSGGFSILYNKFLEFAKSQHVDTITLSSYPKNTHAIAIYDKFGFTISSMIMYKKFNNI